MAKRRHKTGFLEQYRLDDTYLLQPDRAKGRPGIYGGFSPDGNPVLVKIWPRAKGVNDQDLEEIWRHELRQLHRLAGYPGAADCIARLHDAGQDAAGFYLILAPGQRRPLQTLLKTSNSSHWIRYPRLPANRVRLWRNLALLARGLETLHSQGLLHRSIDTWAVLTAGGDDPDFQLTGFEWSMRVIGGTGDGQVHLPQRRDQIQDSFLRDWLMYGLLAADLLGVNMRRLADIEIAAHDVADHLNAEEVTLLRNIAQVQPILPFNGEIVVERIDRVARLLAEQVAHRSPKLHLALRLGTGTPLAERIREASQNEIEADDMDGQLNFVVADLRIQPLLLAVKPLDGGEGLRLLLRGKNLTYRLQEFRPPGSNGTWEVAYCERTERTAPAPVNVIGQLVLESSSLEIMTLASAHNRLPRLRGKVRSWQDWIREFESQSAPPTREQITHKALSLIQFLEALYAVADVFPVEVLPADATVGADDNLLRLRARRDPERDNLAKALGLKPPAHRLHQELTGDRVKPEGWILSDSKSLGERSPADTEWRFQDVEPSTSGPEVYVFVGTHPAPNVREAFLVPEGAVGRDAQFRRRLKALRALADHEELLKMMTDPRQRIIDSHDRVVVDESFKNLDDPKQDALRELVSTLPFYLIQGPPGVGKTRLVRDLVRRRFQDEPTLRLLLTAQSNAAIDHLMDELEVVLDKDPQNAPLVVRCSGKDDIDAPSHFDIRVKARQLISQFAASELAQTLPETLRAALTTLAVSASQGDQMSISTIFGRPAPHALRAFEGVVARAANVVFATTNSSELERLIDERGQCDWAIVEEAAKATGSELVSPMLLSHRRLMIGDHKQLPPFATDRMIDLLAKPEAVRDAMTIGEEFVGRALRDTTTEEILDEIEDEEAAEAELPRLCAEALRVLMFFETTIEAEFDRQRQYRPGRAIAKRLTQQHRMHPDIASLVSHCFYRDLTSHADCIRRYRETPRPFASRDSTRLPSTPVVIVDMPYVQAAVGTHLGERYPRWNNPREVRAVLEVLSLVKGSNNDGKKPTLAVLSPYGQQVRRLSEAIHDAPSPHNFVAPSHDGVWCHTVDSFQGSEADLVVVSFVRNNGHSNVQSAFGFLSDARRMNVLLSRARWQMVLVVSLEFVREVLQAVHGSPAAQSVRFLHDMLDWIERHKGTDSLAVVPFEQLTRRTK